MGLIDKIIFFWAVFLIVIGLIFEASGFGIVVTGRLDGLILVAMGVSLFWGGWIMSQANGIWFAAAATLNMFDAASTVAFWNFEVNPLVVSMGPSIFMAAKITSSLTIMMYARLQPSVRRAGMVLTLLFAIIVSWNLSQHLLAYLGSKGFVYGILVGAVFSFLVSALVIYILLAGEKSSKRNIML